jgi:hypothetical protein
MLRQTHSRNAGGGQEHVSQGVFIVSQIDLDGSSFRVLTAEEARDPAVTSTSRQDQELSPASKARSWIGRAIESAIYGVLILPFAVAICAIVAFAILPLHSDSRCDDGYD